MTNRSPELVLSDAAPDCCVYQYRVGSAKNFAYLLVDPASRKAFLVDPAWSPLDLVEEAAAQGFELSGALLTHTHADHMAGYCAGDRSQGSTSWSAKSHCRSMFTAAKPTGSNNSATCLASRFALSRIRTRWRWGP